jgi:hypothetical protein
LGVSPDSILFATDNVDEAIAAQFSGMSNLAFPLGLVLTKRRSCGDASTWKSRVEERIQFQDCSINL